MFPWTLTAVFLGGLLIFPGAVTAQDETEDKNEPGPWGFGGILTLGLNQSTFSNNWAGDDEGNINWVATFDGRAQRQFTRKFRWSNVLTLKYGERQDQYVDDDGKKQWSAPKKSNDQIQLESVGRFTLERHIDPYVAFRWDSKFVDETSPLKTLYLNPNRFSETAGVTRVFAQEERREVLSRLGFGFVQHISRVFPDAASDRTETQNTNEGGFEWQTDALWSFAEDRLIYRGQLLVFLPVFFNESDKLKEFDDVAIATDPTREKVQDFWRDPTVNFQNTFDAKVTEWLTVNLFLQLIYEKFDRTVVIDPAQPELVDAGIRKAGQFKQTLAVALTYRLL